MASLKAFIIDKAEAQRSIAQLDEGDIAVLVIRKHHADGDHRLHWHAIGESTCVEALGLASWMQHEIWHAFDEISEEEDA